MLAVTLSLVGSEVPNFVRKIASWTCELAVRAGFSLHGVERVPDRRQLFGRVLMHRNAWEPV